MARAQDEYVIKFGIEGENALAKLRVELTQANKKLREHTKLTETQNGASTAAIQRNKKLTTAHQRLKESIKAQTAALKTNVAQTKKSSKSLASMAVKAIMARATIRALSQFLISAVKDFADFEKGIKNVTTLMTGDDAEIFSGGLFRGALAVSKEYGFALKDITKAMFDAVSAGVAASDTMTFLGEASRLAMAGVTTLKSATMGLTTVMNAYGMSADKARMVAEVLFTTQKYGVTTVAELSKSLGVVVPFAAAAGISIEELGAAIATTTRSGLDAAKSVTALRAAISQMQKPAAASRDLFIKFGIPIGSAQLKAVGFTETMRRLNEVYKESPTVIEKMFGNVRGLTAIFSLAGDNAEEYQEILSMVSDATERSGNLTDANASILESMDTKLNILSASWTQFKINIGDSDFFKSLVSEMTDSLDVLGSAYLGFWDKVMFTSDKSLAKHNMEKELEWAFEVRENLRDIAYNNEDVKVSGMIGSPEGIPKEEEERVKSMMKTIEDSKKARQIYLKHYGIDIKLNYTALLSDYNDYIKGIKAIDDAEKEDKKADDADKTARAQAAQLFEYEQRVKLKSDIEKIQLDSLKNNTYAGVTEEDILRIKLANFTELESFYQKNKGANEEEVLRASNRVAKLGVELKRKILQNESKNAKEYNDAQDLLADKHYSDSVEKSLEQAKTLKLTNDEFNLIKINDEIKYYNDLKEIEGSSVAEREKNLKTMNSLTIRKAKLEKSMDEKAKAAALKNTEEYNSKQKALADQFYTDSTAAALSQAQTNKLTSNEFGLKVVEDKIKHYEDLKALDGASTEEQAKNLRKLNSLYIQRARLMTSTTAAATEKALENTDDYNLKQAALEEAYYSKSTTEAQKQAETNYLTKKEFRIRTIQNEIQYYNDLTNLDGASTDEQMKNRRKLNSLTIKLAKTENSEDEENNSKKVALAKDAISRIGEARKEALASELAQELKAMDRRSARIDQEVEDGLIGQRQAAKEKEKIEKESFELRKSHELKMAKISFMIELANIAVNAAANPTNAVTFGGAGISQYALLAGLAIGRYAMTASTIKAQEFAKGGMVYGNSHAQGGEKFAVGGRVVELEGGEAVINKRSSAMFGGALSAMNEAGGGVSFSSPNRGGSSLIDYEALGRVIGRNTNVVLPVESLNRTQNRVKMLESLAKF
tara:strand:+ start:2967 stop:6467 length:3501 start_codon:yes stop_codon:yes gene_type:complete